MATQPIEMFLYYTTATEFDQVRPIVERMLASPIAKARQAAGRQATLAALSDEAPGPLADLAMIGDPETRKGAAKVLSTNILRSSERAYCEARLIALFNDPDQEVRRTAGDWVRDAPEEGRVEPVLRVAEAFVESLALAENLDGFFRALEEAVDTPPSLLLRADRRFVEITGSAAGELSTRSAFTAASLSKLILRAYRQAEKEPDLRRLCLDLFDRLLEVGGYGADEAIKAFDR